MTWVIGGALAALVGALLAAQRHPRLRAAFRWLPLPLWCYAIPAIAAELGWLPRAHPAYREITDAVLPFALALLLTGTDLPSVLRIGPRALGAAAIGSAGVLIGAPLGAWLLASYLPAEAWRGAGALAGTWTGGTMNLLALRSVLELTDPLFAPLIVVDAVVAYGWMALLVAASGFQPAINKWLGADAREASSGNALPPKDAGDVRGGVAAGVGLALFIAALAWRVGRQLPPTAFISSGASWTVLLVTTAALGVSLAPRLRAAGESGSVIGYPALYLVLAATGAQGDLGALWATPAWIGLGLITVAVHGAALVLAGRVFKLPLGLLATASQANIGGVVSAPLVGAVYHKELAPIGLLLAVAGNALGTYLGLLAATLAHLLT